MNEISLAFFKNPEFIFSLCFLFVVCMAFVIGMCIWILIEWIKRR